MIENSRPADPTRWKPPGGVFGRTYYLLRWSMPVLLGWLTFAIGYAWIKALITREIRLPMTSISAYYYTDAQTVFVGVLIGLGVLLVVIQGRTPWEDALMNTAGALAPFVALLPTPVKADDRCIESYCTVKFLNDVIPNNEDIIAFNVWTVLPIWLTLCLYLAFRASTLRGGDGFERYSSIFSASAATIFGLVALGLWVTETEQQLFYDWAHGISAGFMVVMLILSIAPFARWIGPSSHRLFAKNRPMLNNKFWLLLWLVLLGILGWLGWWRLVNPDWDHKVLVIELVAIVPFLVYWVLQGLALGKLDAKET